MYCKHLYKIRTWNCVFRGRKIWIKLISCHEIYSNNHSAFTDRTEQKNHRRIAVYSTDLIACCENKKLSAFRTYSTSAAVSHLFKYAKKYPISDTASTGAADSYIINLVVVEPMFPWIATLPCKIQWRRQLTGRAQGLSGRQGRTDNYSLMTNKEASWLGNIMALGTQQQDTCPSLFPQALLQRGPWKSLWGLTATHRQLS